MRTVRYAFPVLVVVLMLILVGCGPKTDTTDKDPLSDYSVDVTLPFPTSGAVSATQTPGYTIRPDAPIKILGWMNGALMELTRMRICRIPAPLMRMVDMM